MMERVIVNNYTLLSKGEILKVDKLRIKGSSGCNKLHKIHDDHIHIGYVKITGLNAKYVSFQSIPCLRWLNHI